LRTEERYYDDLKWHGRMHGATFDDDKESVPSSTMTPVKSQDNLFRFRRPEDYAKMSVEEREELSKKMMGFYKSWAERSNSLGVSCPRK